MRSSLRLSSMLVSILLSATALCQGIYTESNTVVQAAGGQTFPGQSYYAPKMMKVITGDNTIIVRLDKQMIYRVNNTEKTYSEMTFEEWEAQMKKASAEMDSKMADLQKKLAGMPPEQRKMMEQLMSSQSQGKDKQAKLDVKNTGEKKTLAGFSATKYVVLQDGKDFITAWTTKEVKGFDAMRKDYEEMTRRLSASGPGGMASMVEAMKKIDGFPLEVVMAMGVTTDVTKVESRSFAASEFEVPSGFTKVAMDLNGNSQK